MTSSKPISLTSATALVVANMVGVGVFTTSGFALADLGSRELVLLAWLLGGLLACCGSLCYGALALRLPESGGEYAYLRRSLHPAAGFAAGVISLLAGFAAPLALAARTLEVYGSRLLGIATPELPLAASAVLLLAALLHGRNVRLGSRWQTAAVLAKLALVLLFLVAAVPQFGKELTPVPVAKAAVWTGMASALPWIALAYSGWNAAVYVAAEIEDAPRNVPRALWRGTLLVTVLYVLLNAAFLWIAEPAELLGRPEVAAIAAATLLGRSGEVLATTIVVLALLTSVLGMTMAGPRVSARMAADGALPRALAPVAAAPPRLAIALQTVLALAFLWIAELQQLMTYIGWTLSLCAAATVVGLLRLRWQEGAAAIPLRGHPWTAWFFLVGTGWLLVGSVVAEPRNAVLGLVTLALAVLLGLCCGNRRAAAASNSAHDQ